MAIANWINLSQSAGTSGITTVTITAATYDQLTARTTNFRVKTVNLNLSETVNILQNPREMVTVSINPSAITADMTGGTYTIDITSNGDWEITNIPSGWTVSQSAGTGNGQITITVPANSGSSALTKTIKISTIDEFATVTVRQSAFIVSPDTINNIPSGGSSYTLTVTAPEDVNWVISNYPNWVTFSSITGTGDGTVTMTVSQNTNNSRRDTITFITTDSAATATVSISQNGDYESKYLTFEIISGGTLCWTSYGYNTTINRTIEYSVNNGEWMTITSRKNGYFGDFYANDVIRFRGNNQSYSDSVNVFCTFSGSTALFNVYGNIMSLIDKNNFSEINTITNSYALEYMFYDCTGLTDASNLILPATTLASGCYRNMFAGCSLLTTAPLILPATTLRAQCYEAMFDNCTNLVGAPELPATTLENYCYRYMFRDCKSLVNAPELPATTLKTNCYGEMFYNCTNLSYIKCLATDLSAYHCTYYWVSGVASSGTFVKAAGMNDWTTGDSGIPNNWTVQDA